MIYDINGNVLSAAYSMDGTPLERAYDTGGNVVFISGMVPTKSTIKVVSYNVGQWYCGTGSLAPADKAEAYYALQTDIIERINADILFLQEYRSVFGASAPSVIATLCSKYPYICTTGVGSGGYNGRAIVSKYPLSGYTEHTYSAERRYYDTATVTVDGHNITLINTHLGLSLALRESEVEELIAYIKSLDSHFILCGDFNMVANATWEEAYDSIVAPMLAEGWHLANGENGAVTTYYGNEDKPAALDNIISDLPISDVYTDTTKLTDDISDTIDHVPLVATVELAT